MSAKKHKFAVTNLLHHSKSKLQQTLESVLTAYDKMQKAQNVKVQVNLNSPMSLDVESENLIQVATTICIFLVFVLCCQPENMRDVDEAEFDLS